MQLRDYQIEAINALEQDLNLYPRSLLVLATGLGKTETIFGFCLRSLEKNPQTKILFLVNKVALVNQTAKRADPFFDVGIFCGSEKLYQTDKQLTVASIQSIHASGDYYDYIILDEVHRASATSYERFIENCTLRNPNVKVIGLTATPFNSNGYIYGDDKFFKSICYEKGLRWAIDNNWLVKPVLKHTEIAFDTASLHSKLGDFDLKEVKELTTNE
jgi:DNA repair protein RadD